VPWAFRSGPRWKPVEPIIRIPVGQPEKTYNCSGSRPTAAGKRRDGATSVSGNHENEMRGSSGVAGCSGGTQEAMLRRMHDAGRVIMVGFAASRPERELLEKLRALQPGGVILFRRNLESPEALAELVLALREVLPPHPLLAVDQEGGRVSRLEPWLGPTPTAERWAQQEEDAVRRFGATTGEVLRGLGFNLDFAPVVDLCPPGAANGIGDRSFGTDPEAVSVQAGAFLDGLQSAGVAGCLKHFPGLGDT